MWNRRAGNKKQQEYARFHGKTVLVEVIVMVLATKWRRVRFGIFSRSIFKIDVTSVSEIHA